MRSKIGREILAATPEDELIFVSWYADLVVRIHELLEEKGLTQKLLAERMGKTAPEISRWLSGDHNFTLRSLAKLQAELGGKLIYIPHKTEFTTVHKSRSSATVVKKFYRKPGDGYNEEYSVSDDMGAYDKLPA